MPDRLVRPPLPRLPTLPPLDRLVNDGPANRRAW